MAESTTTFLLTRMLGISGSAFISGFAFSASYYSVPAIALAPIPLRLRQWQVVYDLGKLVAPPVSAVSAILLGVAAYSTSSTSNDWKLYATAGALTFSFTPWTVLAMMATNNDLMRRAKMGAELEGKNEGFERESEKALNTWWRLNWVRAVLPMAGAWIALYAALK